MNLREIFEIAKEKTYSQVMGKYKRLIDKAAENEPLEDVILFYKNKFFREKNSLFVDKVNPGDTYHFIVHFNTIIAGLKGKGLTLDKKISIAQRMTIKQYTDHEYLPAIHLFFNQGLESIAQKLGAYSAFCKVENIFNQAVTEIRKQLGKMTLKKDPFTEGSDESNEYAKLFRRKKHLTKAEKVIKKHMIDEYGNWKFIKNEKQSFPVLMIFLRNMNYLSHFDDDKLGHVVDVFSRRYNFTLAKRTRTTIGKKETDFVKEYKSIFPVLND